ncbi:TonB-dependent receptor [Sandarakinorhabdus sp.]|uniref:TonB-dependent receptor n=1 Tax=Sandarakinorhabdus sp. TaxID=1916663 RepID=UPI00334047E4
MKLRTIAISQLALATALLTLDAVPALAQATTAAAVVENTGIIEDIVVTAQRRRERAQDVPIAITAFSAEALQARGVVNALDLTQFVPNLVGLNNTGLGTANAYYLRGLGNTESVATFDPPVGTYIDDIYISRQNANNFNLFDVERVEVLRGPQGTLFGRNTTGGAISVVMREPGDTTGGYVEAGFGAYDQKLVRAGVDLPVSGNFGLKLSGYWQEDDGWVRNTVTNERLNNNNGWGLRLGARAKLSDSITWNGSITHTFADATNVLNFDCNPANPAQCDGRFATTGLRRSNDFGGRFVGPKDDFGNYNKARMTLLTSNFGVALSEKINLNVITGWLDLSQKFALDFADGTSLPSLSSPTPPVRSFTPGGFVIANDGSHRQFTQEVKLSGSLADGLIDLVTGLYYFKETNNTDFADLFNIGSAGPVGFPLVLADRTLRNTTEAWAGYGQVDVHPIESVTLTAGIRYTDEEKTFGVRDNRASCNDGTIEAGCIDSINLSAPNGVAIPRAQKVQLWTPRFAMSWKASNDILLFASATNGFKSGGWNARGTAASELLPFGPEKAWSYETGFKADLFGKRLRFNMTAFIIDVAGLQTPSAFVRPNGSVAFLTRNFADYLNKGIEAEFSARPTEALTLFGSLGYQDDRYALPANAPTLDEYNFQSVAAQQISCRQQLAAGRVALGATAEVAGACGVGIVAPDGSIATPVRTPAWTMSMGATYEVKASDKVSIIPSANVNWRSSSEVGTSAVSLFNQPFTSAGGTRYPANAAYNGDFIRGSFSQARWIANASLMLKHADGWQVLVECRNCFDEEAVESSLANHSYLNPPRTWTIRARHNF